MDESDEQYPEDENMVCFEIGNTGEDEIPGGTMIRALGRDDWKRNCRRRARAAFADC